MKTVIALLAVLAVAAVCVSVKGALDEATWVSNQSSKSIRASTEYDFPGHSDFHNRLITPGTAQEDVYASVNCDASVKVHPVGVTLWIDGSLKQYQIWIPCDRSIVGEDNFENSGVNIYDSVFREINTPTDNLLSTLYP